MELLSSTLKRILTMCKIIVHLIIVLMIFRLLMMDLLVTSTIWLLLHTAWFVIAVIEDLMEHLH